MSFMTLEIESRQEMQVSGFRFEIAGKPTSLGLYLAGHVPLAALVEPGVAHAHLEDVGVIDGPGVVAAATLVDAGQAVLHQSPRRLVSIVVLVGQPVVPVPLAR